MNATELNMNVLPIIARYFFQEHPGHTDADIATRDYQFVDHIIPVAKTQKNAIARILLSMKGCSSVNDIKNLAPACRNCNLKKSDKMGMWIFRGWLGRYRTYWVVLNIIKALSVLLMILGILYIFGIFTKF